jgi:hypothetical protein
MPRRCVPALSLAALPLLATSACLAQGRSFHLMQIEQVIGGVNGDTSKQAVQLRMRSAGENFVTGVQVIAYDAAGLNPVVIETCPSDVSNFDQGARILIATANFPSPVPPDFIMSPIPASYLSAGRLTWEFFGGVYWSLAWGGAGYTGPTTGFAINDPDGDFGPPWGGPLPSAGVQGLLFQGPAGASSSGNSLDYALTAGAASFTNNRGDSGALPSSCYANCDGSTATPTLNVQDFSCFLGKFAAGDPYANCDGSTAAPTLNVQDFSCFLGKFAAGCP